MRRDRIVSNNPYSSADSTGHARVDGYLNGSLGGSDVQIEQLVTVQQKHIKNQKLQLEALRSRVKEIEFTVGQISNSNPVRAEGIANFNEKFCQQSDDSNTTVDARYMITPELSDHASHQMTPDFLACYQRSLKSSRMSDNAIRRERFFHLYQLLRMTRGVPGHTAETGVFRGCSSFLTCEVLKEEEPDFDGHSHYMIDSFEGLSEPVEKDGDYPTKRQAESAFTNTSVEVVRETMSDYPRANILKGWIPEILQKLPDQQYRFVHVDVDVYEPTLASLRYFFPKLSQGGAILCDDYGPWKNNNWPGCIQAVNEFSQEIGQQFFLLDSGNVFFIKR